MTAFPFTGYRGTFEGVDHHDRAGTLRFRGGRWSLHCWSSGATVGGGVLRATITVTPGRGPVARVALSSDDGRYQGHLTVLVPAGRVTRRLATCRRVAEDSAERRERVRQGEWWLADSVFAAFGPSAAASVTDVRYVGGWTGPVRRGAGRRPGMLDVDADGLLLRGWRRRLRIPWDVVEQLNVEGGVGLPATLTVSVRGGDRARFEATREDAPTLRRRLAPVLARTSP